MAKFSRFDTSLWFATAAPAPATFPLEEHIRADVCIVGAGYTGLTTALELARKGVDVVVLEAQEAGFGGSGRNAGHCTPTFTHFSLPDLRNMLGEPWAERLIARQTQANSRVADMIQRYQIQCEWRQNGYVMAAARPSAIPGLEQRVRDYNAVGAKTRLIDRAGIEAITGSPRFFGGWFHSEGGHLNPLGYARGLARAALQEGVKLFTQSEVTDVAPERGAWSVATERGSVSADKVIFATGAYTVGGWPKLDQSFKIMRVFVAATQPLSDEERESVLPQNTTIHDGRGDFYVYKRDVEGRIVASMLPMGRRGRDTDYTRKVMSDRLKWLHPQIRQGIRWEYFWFGELDMQRRTIPRLYGLAPGVVALTGLSGRGVPTGSMLGGILSEWALDVPDKDLSLRIEPLHRAPAYMSYAPHLALRYRRASDWVRGRRPARPAGHSLLEFCTQDVDQKWVSARVSISPWPDPAPVASTAQFALTNMGIVYPNDFQVGLSPTRVIADEGDPGDFGSQTIQVGYLAGEILGLSGRLSKADKMIRDRRSVPAQTISYGTRRCPRLIFPGFRCGRRRRHLDPTGCSRWARPRPTARYCGQARPRPLCMTRALRRSSSSTRLRSPFRPERIEGHKTPDPTLVIGTER